MHIIVKNETLRVMTNNTAKKQFSGVSHNQTWPVKGQGSAFYHLVAKVARKELRHLKSNMYLICQVQ